MNKKYLISSNALICDALLSLNNLSIEKLLFIVNDSGALVGSLTDGDIRRGLIEGYKIDQNVNFISNKAPKCIKQEDLDPFKIQELRKSGFKIIPIVDKNYKIIDFLDFKEYHTILPIDVVVMAGGRGQRLLPLTKNVPKPLLKVGDKAIIDYNINRLSKFGVKNFWISVNYLKDQIIQHFDNSNHIFSIKFINENMPLGTIGSITKIKNFENKYILLCNSDLLTNVNFESFFLDFLKQEADVSILSVPYEITLPYAIFDKDKHIVTALKEKPTITFDTNGGIYLIKKELIEQIPKDIFYNATDFIEKLIDKKYKIITYSFSDYWLDIGSHSEFERAQKDIHNINFEI
jgi:dTDP-glucose pyrophosphorylase